MALGALGWVHSAELDIYKPTNWGGDGLFFRGKGRLVMGHDTIYLWEKNVLKLLYIDVKLCNDSRNFHFSQQNALDVVSCIKLTLVQKNRCSTG